MPTADLISAAKIQPADIRRIIRALEVHKEGTISRQHEEHKASATGRPVMIAGLKRDRAELYKRIEERVDAMMVSGFLEEDLPTLEAKFLAAGLKETGCLIAENWVALTLRRP
jgi:tRNA dimethylallyltransferase